MPKIDNEMIVRLIIACICILDTCLVANILNYVPLKYRQSGIGIFTGDLIFGGLIFTFLFGFENFLIIFADMEAKKKWKKWKEKKEKSE